MSGERPLDDTRDAVPHRPRDSYAHLTVRLLAFGALAPGDARRRVLRDELAAGYWPVVVFVARRYGGRGEPLEDLEQVGAVGLMGALERFDPGRGVDFLGFAVPTITGEIRRHFRDRTWSMRVPRRLKDLQVPLREAVSSLTTSLQRAPRPTEIAVHLGVTVADVVEALTAQRAYTLHSLDTVVERSGAVDVSLGDLLGQLDAAFATVDHRDALRQAVARLSDREQRIVALRFFGDLTQTQIAAEIGVSQIHISRLITQTLATLRRHLGAP